MMGTVVKMDPVRRSCHHDALLEVVYTTVESRIERVSGVLPLSHDPTTKPYCRGDSSAGGKANGPLVKACKVQPIP